MGRRGVPQRAEVGSHRAIALSKRANQGKSILFMEVVLVWRVWQLFFLFYQGSVIVLLEIGAVFANAIQRTVFPVRTH